MGFSATIMPVSSRIKILKCSSFEEVEQKVNDFLAFDEHIIHLAGIDYRLEFNVVIIEYDVMPPDSNINKNKIIGSGPIVVTEEEEDYSSSSRSILDFSGSMFSGWLKLYFPFART